MGSDVKFKVDSHIVEQGELSNPESKQLDLTTSNTTSFDKDSSKNNKNKYWMKDLYKYSYPRGYGAASGLYNLAWAQAVQNKPLNEVLVEFKDKKGDDKTTNKSSVSDDPSVKANQQSVVEVVDVESEKEEGELEEGEIDLDSEEDNKNSNHEADEYMNSGSGFEMDDGELERQVSSIRKVLDNVTASEALKSFDIVCARLRSSLESLTQLVKHTWFPSKDALIQRSFDAIQCVNSVFSTMSPTLRDQNKDKMLRLLTFVMSLHTSLFTPKQGEEVQAMISLFCPPAIEKPKPKDTHEFMVTDKAILTDSNTLAVNTSDDSLDYSKTTGMDVSEGQNSNTIISDMVKPSSSSSSLQLNVPLQLNVKVRGNNNNLLLDLHKVHDEDSLPSPTSKAPPSLPSFDSRVVHHGVQKFGGMHPYETDAMKAVSTYQQKFGRSTFLALDRLPSPTPSEEGNEGGGSTEDASNDEVSSVASDSNTRTTNPSVSMQPQFSHAAVNLNSSSIQGMLVSSGSTSGLGNAVGYNSAPQATAKSRDPRLRRNNSPNLGSVGVGFNSSASVVPTSVSKLESLGEIMNQKKMKASEGHVLDGHSLKKQKIGVETTDIPSISVSKHQTVYGSISSGSENSGAAIGSQFTTSTPPLWPATDLTKLRNMSSASPGTTSNMISPSVIMNAATSQSVGNVTSTTASLQSLLKDLAGNPSAWMNILKEQQKSSSESSQSMLGVGLPNLSSVLGAVSSSPNVAPPYSSGLGQTSAGSLQVSQVVVTSPLDESTKLRMKPRDPRRVLHSNSVHKAGGSSAAEQQPKVKGLGNDNTKGGVQDNMQRLVSGANTNPASSQASAFPDITLQFTKNLKNIADIVSSPQASAVQLALPVSSTSQAVQVTLDRVVDTNSGNGSASRPEDANAARRPSPQAWGDLEHLFDGYDDKQKAAIHQERTRRMDEQKKMFAARKLCLVLDLDHTLLNSAKFTEVDPVHDEILRKKEEQDREKSRRHLFRFPHMCMWTKLRPGIWNFLEKASNLYELHLYTMGNKLYATEMAKILDPNGELFAGRVISKGDDGDLLDGDERVSKSKDLDGVLGMESAVVIIDDSVRVWPHNKLNLIVVERYTYFPCSRRQFGLPGPSLLEIDHDERPEEGTLASSLAVIEKIHQNFFTNKTLDDVDVRSILATEQRKILGGCRIVFSRVFPVGEANPHLHPLWQTAEQFGAVCTNQIDEQVTHVVANSLGTDKVNWALSTGRFVVHPGWVEASALLYRRANEQDFAIKP